MELKNLEENLAALEALLFINGEPLTEDKIAKILNLDRADVKIALTEFEKRLAAENRGLALISGHDRVQLATKPQFSEILEKFVKEELREDLTPASLETLSIITYLGPIARSRLEYLRGINSSFILRSLLLRGLVERSPDPQNPNAYLYQPSLNLIKYLGLKRQADLPEYQKFQLLLENFNSQDKSQESPE